VDAQSYDHANKTNDNCEPTIMRNFFAQAFAHHGSHEKWHRKINCHRIGQWHYGYGQYECKIGRAQDKRAQHHQTQ
jgi:hypothetical protein